MRMRIEREGEREGEMGMRGGAARAPASASASSASDGPRLSRSLPSRHAPATAKAKGENDGEVLQVSKVQSQSQSGSVIYYTLSPAQDAPLARESHCGALRRSRLSAEAEPEYRCAMHPPPPLHLRLHLARPLLRRLGPPTAGRHVCAHLRAAAQHDRGGERAARASAAYETPPRQLHHQRASRPHASHPTQPTSAEGAIRSLDWPLLASDAPCERLCPVRHGRVWERVQEAKKEQRTCRLSKEARGLRTTQIRVYTYTKNQHTFNFKEYNYKIER